MSDSRRGPGGSATWESDIVAGYEDDVIGMWKHADSPDYGYFEVVEDSTEAFWGTGTLFRQLFDRMDTSSLLEIACGQGRHTASVPEGYEILFALDTSVDAIEVAKRRFARNSRIVPLLSDDGHTIPRPAETLTAVFSYDAMVHFEPVTMASYLRETSRVLEPGGRALFHHSMYDRNPTGKFTDSPNWRNYMTFDLFRHLVSRAGLVVVDQHTLSWGGTPNSDGLTLLAKPAD